MLKFARRMASMILSGGRMVAAASVCISLISTGPATAQNQAAESRFSSICPHDCIETGDGSAASEDWISYRCEAGDLPDVFLFFTDGVRLSLAFGDEDASVMGFVADREPTWPVEWRGRIVSGRFLPYAAVVRMRKELGYPPTLETQLVVFSLTGSRCVLGTIEGARANERARRLADNGRC